MRTIRRTAKVQPPSEDRVEVSLENLGPEIHWPITEEATLHCP